MNPIIATLGAFRAAFHSTHTPSLNADERYLAEAQDISDLEHRMRELDEHRGPQWANGFLAIYPSGSGR